jgi:hypothetical protein
VRQGNCNGLTENTDVFILACLGNVICHFPGILDSEQTHLFNWALLYTIDSDLEIAFGIHIFLSITDSRTKFVKISS